MKTIEDLKNEFANLEWANLVTGLCADFLELSLITATILYYVYHHIRGNR